MPSAGKLPSGVGTEVMEGLLLLRGTRIEIRSSGIIGHTEVKILRFDLAVSPVEIGDASSAIEIASLRNSKVMIGNAATFDDYFADAVTNVGLKGEQAQMNLDNQTAIMADLRTMRDSISGVNIDEELADIIKFQHGYNAAARFITVVDELLDTVINRLGV